MPKKTLDSLQEVLGAWDGRGSHGRLLAPVSAGQREASPVHCSPLPHNPPTRGSPKGSFALLAAASPWRSRISAQPPRGTPPSPPDAESVEPEKKGRWRPELSSNE